MTEKNLFIRINKFIKVINQHDEDFILQIRFNDNNPSFAYVFKRVIRMKLFRI
jgi:hypothetical protein